MDLYNMTRPKIVAVDGPAGSGKSSICATVCKDLGWSYVNTGALYRAIGLLCLDRGTPFTEGPEMNKLLDDFSEAVRWEHETARLFVGIDDVTSRLNSVEAGNGASAIAKMPMVRQALLPLQRRLSLLAPKGAMVDGRDIGTVVFPDADLKIFMTASLEQRALRRLRQLETSGGSSGDLSHDAVLRAIASRDDQDSQRDSAPLRRAEDAILFDTSDMDIAQAVANLKELLRSKGLV